MLRHLRIENFVLIREAELAFAPGLNAVTGETGAGKTIFAQAIGLLLGARGDPAYVGPGGEEAYVEAELDLAADLGDEREPTAIAELRPADEPTLVAARRIFSDGRTRAYAWGRTVAREDLAALVERLVAMSGQFEQRRLARSSFQLDLVDAYVGDEQLGRRSALAQAWRDHVAARRRYEEATRVAAGEADRIAELRELVARTDGLEPGGEDDLRLERERLRNVGELAASVATAAEALVPEVADREG
ncbi:MAG: AAA family ATPase, partial [Actinomycetota bacterium]|nr:AAA family ATPase [Actinomycetota bacterium]